MQWALSTVNKRTITIHLQKRSFGLLVPNMKKSIRLLYVVILTMIVNLVLNQFLSSSLSILISTLGCALIGMCFISKEDLQWNLEYWFSFFVYPPIYQEFCQLCLWIKLRCQEGFRHFYGKSQNARDFSHEMNDVCNWFSAVSIREPWYNIYVEYVTKEEISICIQYAFNWN